MSVLATLLYERTRVVSLRDVLHAFGFDTALGVEREFCTDLGAPKAIVRFSPATRLFVGSLNGKRAKAPLEVVFPALNEIGARLAERSTNVEIGPYFRARSGEYVILDGQYYRFITPAFEGREPALGTHGQTLSRALGLFHQVGAEVAQEHPEWTKPRGSTRDSLQYFVLPQFASASGDSVTGLKTQLARSRSRMNWLLDHRADDIDRLPFTYTHNDFQPRNVLIRERPRGDPVVRVVDAESGSWQSRLYDLYYLLFGSDTISFGGDLDPFSANMQAYVRTGGPLNKEEERLLPDVLQCKAAMIAAWAFRALSESPPKKQGLLQGYFETALGCIGVIDDRSVAIRSTACGK